MKMVRDNNLQLNKISSLMIIHKSSLMGIHGFGNNENIMNCVCFNLNYTQHNLQNLRVKCIMIKYVHGLPLSKIIPNDTKISL